MIEVVNQKTWKPDGREWVYIGRPSIYGNPVVLRGEDSRGRVVRLHDDYLINRYHQDPEFARAIQRLVDLAEQDDLVLVCWCSPKPCHGDNIKRLVERILEELINGQPSEIEST